MNNGERDNGGVQGKELGEYMYQDMKKPIRYLGTWSTVNMEKQWGIQLLRKKDAKQIRRHTTAMQKPSKQGKNQQRKGNLSIKLYNGNTGNGNRRTRRNGRKKIKTAVLKGPWTNMRTDILYEQKSHGGLGMTKLTEEYKENRLRTMAQIIEGGERQKVKRTDTMGTKTTNGRNGKRSNPCLGIIKGNEKIHDRNECGNK